MSGPQRWRNIRATLEERHDDRAEHDLKAAVEAARLDYTINPGEGAFYGPKLEFVLRDALGRDWQCGTLQLDFVMPERLGAAYVGEDGGRHRPVMTIGAPGSQDSWKAVGEDGSRQFALAPRCRSASICSFDPPPKRTR